MIEGLCTFCLMCVKIQGQTVGLKLEKAPKTVGRMSKSLFCSTGQVWLHGKVEVKLVSCIDRINHI